MVTTYQQNHASKQHFSPVIFEGLKYSHIKVAAEDL